MRVPAFHANASFRNTWFVGCIRRVCLGKGVPIAGVSRHPPDFHLPESRDKPRRPGIGCSSISDSFFTSSMSYQDVDFFTTGFERGRRIF